MLLSIVEAIVLGKLRSLSLEKQQQALPFIESLELDALTTQLARCSLKGALAHLNQHFTAEDLYDARREMWNGYMQEDFK